MTLSTSKNIRPVITYHDKENVFMTTIDGTTLIIKHVFNQSNKSE